MSDSVNVSPQSLRDLARELERYEENIRQSLKNASAAIARTRWSDRKREQFEARFKDFERQSGRFAESEVRTMVRYLKELASRIEHARDTRM